MQGCDYSRVERFLAVEKPELLPLPGERYQMKRHALLTVAPNCFVQLGRERHHYSVPSRLIGNKVEVIFTDTQVRIYHDGNCIATHMRSFKHGGYTWVKEHLHSQTQAYYGYSPQYFIDKDPSMGLWLSMSCVSSSLPLTDPQKCITAPRRASWLSPVRQSLSFFFLRARYPSSTENATIHSSAIW